MPRWSWRRWFVIVALAGGAIGLLALRVTKPSKFDNGVHKVVGFDPTATEWRVAVFVVLAAALVAVIIWEIPRLQVARWRRRGIDEQHLAELGNSARATLTQALGGLALVATLALTAYSVNQTQKSSSANIRVAEEGQATQLISHSVDQLGATTGGEPSLPTRVGALYALARLATTQDRAEIVNEIFAAYVRVNQPTRRSTSTKGAPCAHTGTRAVAKLRPDVTTALDLIAKLDPYHANPYLNDVPYKVDDADLQRVDFSDGVLERVRFERVDLIDASFRGADLRDAVFDSVSIGATDFRDACLHGATFKDDYMQENWGGIAFDARGADVRGAKFEGQTLKRFLRENDKLKILVDAHTKM